MDNEQIGIKNEKALEPIIKKKPKKLTDDEAVALSDSQVYRFEVATKFVERTIFTPSHLRVQGGDYVDRNVALVTAGTYTSQAKWEKALQTEKEYPKLQVKERAKITELGGVWKLKDPGNVLNARPFEVGK